jgi:hypothetical protein
MKAIKNAKPIPTPSFDGDGLDEIRAIADPSWHNANGAMPMALRQPKETKPDPPGMSASGSRRKDRSNKEDSGR